MIWVVTGMTALLIWWFVGCCVLAAVDKEGHLLKWVSSFPGWGWLIAVTGWPIVVWKYMKNARD